MANFFRKLAILLCIGSVSCKELTVNPANGTDETICFDGLVPCKSLGYVLENGKNILNKTKILLEPGVYYIYKSYEMHYLVNFMIISENATLNCMNSESGFTFLGSHYIEMRNLTFVNCGVKHRSTTEVRNSSSILYDRPNVYIAVTFVYSKNIIIDKCEFIENNGIGLAFYNPVGNVRITASYFYKNTNINNKRKNDTFISGGGLYIEYTLCNVLSPYLCNYFTNYNRNAKIVVLNSSFESNLAENTYGLTADDEKFKNSYLTFGDGGGVSINFFGNAAGNKIIIDSCVFVNNSAIWGGGLCVTLKDKAELNEVNILKSYFHKNAATYGGGGIRVESLYPQDYRNDPRQKFSKGNKITITSTTYDKNKAIIGGGISITATTRLIYNYDSQSRDVLFDNCTFTRNEATVGYAIGMNTINLNREVIGPGMSYRVIFKNCNFENNAMVFTEDKKVIGHGALYSDQVTLVFHGDNRFLSNDYTALVLQSSSLKLYNNSLTHFMNNSGIDGGAIAIYGMSWILLCFRSTVLFLNNTAQSRGGGIYAKTRSSTRMAFNITFLFTSHCFIRYEDRDIKPDDWPVDIIFDNNKSPKGSGNSIYTSTLQFCREKGTSRDNVEALSWASIKFKNNFRNQAEVVTNAIDLNVDEDEWAPSPFLPFSPNVTILDEKKQSVFGSVKLLIKDGADVHLEPPNNHFLIRSKLLRLRMAGKENTNFNFNFISTSGQLFETRPFNRTLKRCPPGFRSNKKSDRCVCMAAENSDVISCDEDGTVHILKGRWAYINTKTNLLNTYPCPPGKCQCKNEIEDYACELDLKNQCIEGRTGILCGECLKGLSVKIGNEKCEVCDYKGLAWIALGLFIIFLVVFVFYLVNFSGFSGYLNALSFSTEVGSVLITEKIYIDPVIKTINFIFFQSNVNNGVGVCFVNGLDNMYKLLLNYVLPLGLILMALIFIPIKPSFWKKVKKCFSCCLEKVEKCFSCFWKNIKKSCCCSPICRCLSSCFSCFKRRFSSCFSRCCSCYKFQKGANQEEAEQGTTKSMFQNLNREKIEEDGRKYTFEEDKHGYCSCCKFQKGANREETEQDISKSTFQENTNREETEEDATQISLQENTNQQETEEDKTRATSQENTKREDSVENTNCCCSCWKFKICTNPEETDRSTTRSTMQENANREESLENTNGCCSCWKFKICKNREQTNENTTRFTLQQNTNQQETQEEDFVGRGFTNVAIVSYTTITETSFRIFRWATINGEGYVYTASATKFFSFWHSFGFAIALVLVLLVTLGFPLAIFLEHFRFKIVPDKISGIISPLKADLKKKCGYFPAFYFVGRIILLIIDMVTDVVINKLIFLSIFCIVILVMFAFLQPYEQMSENVFEIFMLLYLPIASILYALLIIPFALDNTAWHHVHNFMFVSNWWPISITIIRFFWRLRQKKCAICSYLRNQQNAID